jgi:hypothetical protein
VSAKLDPRPWLGSRKRRANMKHTGRHWYPGELAPNSIPSLFFFVWWGGWSGGREKDHEIWSSVRADIGPLADTAPRYSQDRFSAMIRRLGTHRSPGHRSMVR